MAYSAYAALKDKIAPVAAVAASLLIGIYTHANYQASMTYFDFKRILSKKWDLVNELIAKAGPQISEGDKICTKYLYDTNDIFDIYGYWPLYFSENLGKKVTVVEKEASQECDWILSYGRSDTSVSISLTRHATKAIVVAETKSLL